ncbi:glycosyltransferase [Burkholderia sp. BCC0405]|uniref:glycosyltransferase family 2 protein n=1 Tax=Burkholderia sp. BCC0405 TaxID=2676298 RepID=UPI00158C7943|nr:glycosyltransferase [Burkholderia sp. BCC0405]
MTRLAISDFIPSGIANTERTGWLSSDANMDEIQRASASLTASDHAEGLLYTSRADTLFHIANDAALRAFQFVASDTSRRAIVYHPVEEQRKQLKALIAQESDSRMVCLDRLDDFANVVAAWQCDKVAAYIDWAFFSLDIVEKISRSARIDTLIGGFEESRFPARQLYQKLKPFARTFRLYSVERQNVIHWNEAQAIDVSIIVPAYNISAYLPQCLDSLGTISGITSEVLVIDDGSKDDTAAVAAAYAEKYSNIRLISQVNGGCAAARQRGLDEARGTYIGFVDGDDWITPGMFEKLVGAAIDTGSDVALCGYVEEYSASGTSHEVEEHFGSAQRALFDCYRVDPDEVVLHAPTIWRKIFRKNFLDVHGVRFHTDIKRFDDLLFNAEVLFCRPHTVATSGHMYHYRLERPGQTVGFKDERLFVHFDIFKALHDRVSALGTLSVERLFKQIQISTHFWVDSLLEDELKSKYRTQAASDIFSNLLLLGNEDVYKLAQGLSQEKEAFTRAIKK